MSIGLQEFVDPDLADRWVAAAALVRQEPEEDEDDDEEDDEDAEDDGNGDGYSE
jgi:hypothetical protein